MHVVLQLNKRALQEARNDPCATAKRLDAYTDVITDVLIDASGGHGIPIDVNASQAYIQAINNRHPQLGIGVAGGLSPDTINNLQPLAHKFSRMSVDAEGRLRTTGDYLDISAMKLYISMADGLFD